MEDPHRPQGSLNPGKSGSSSAANQVQNVVDPVHDAGIVMLMVVMLLLGLMRWAMTPCVC